MRLTLGSAAAALLFFGAYHGSWGSIVANVVTALLFSATIGGSLQLILPRISPVIFRRAPAPLNWALLLAVMMAVAAAGSALSIAVIVGLGWLPRGSAIQFFADSMRISLGVTLTFGVGVTLYQRLRHRADAAELALRTKERDEADARRMATEARLASLESRVQPHFLFNTLNSIAALIPEDPAGAERMTAQLASLLRSSLASADAPLVPLEQELRSTEDYLGIERVRFGDRLRYRVEVAPACRRTLVPRFSLQSLAENSVKYAVAPRRQGGLLQIAAEDHGDRIRLIVEDDGPGFDGTLAEPGHGLALLRERIALSYGASASLRIDSRPGCSRVMLEVPR